MWTKLAVLLGLLPIFVGASPDGADSAASKPKPPSPPTAELPALRPVLDAWNYDAWKRTIEPTSRETGWREIPWQPTLQSGFRLAHAEKKPVLLWIMNGHPLGCT